MAELNELTFGEVIQGTLDVVRSNVRPMALYVLIFTIVGTAIEWGVPAAATQDGIVDLASNISVSGALGVTTGVVVLLVFLLSVLAQYMLWAKLLENEQLGDDPVSNRYLAFLGQTILATIGTGIGFLFLVLPGIFVLARWAMAPAYLIGNNQGAVEALGNSWDAMKGNTGPVFVAILVGAIAVTGTGAIVGGFEVYAGSETSLLGLLAIALAQAVSNAGAVLAVGLGVFLFGYFHGNAESLQQIFE